MRPIHSVAVLGAGTMGAQIAAHFANAGVPVQLFDISLDAARHGLDRARSTKPDPFVLRETWTRITPGSIDDHLARIADVDWIIEAVVERLDVKRPLLEKVEAVRRPGSIVSSNTSAISIAALADSRSHDFRAHWLGTHFFNPPRYLHLLEVIPTSDTDPRVIERVTAFADRRLGKGVVLAKDSPGFIGNHVALFGLMLMLHAVAAGDYSIDEVDAMTGPVLGRPKSATFRTLDIAGLDIVAHVVSDLAQRLSDPVAREVFRIPAFVDEMLRRGLGGEKAGAGFYKRVKGAGGESEIFVINPSTLEYEPRRRVTLGSLETARTIADVAERIRWLFEGSDRVGAFLRRTLAPALAYAGRVAPAVASSIDDIDRVLRWGFGWEIGPFELCDAIGPQRVLEVTADVMPGVVSPEPPATIAAAMQSPSHRLREAPLPPAAADLLILRAAKDRSRIVRKNAGASLVDLDDGVLCVEFHSKMNTLGPDALQMIRTGIREASERFAALVIGNEAEHFSAGANLMLVLLEAREQNWDELDALVRTAQQTTLAIRYADVPVVVAVGGMALGGGCEIALHADRIQAAAETYMGLVETGVGVIPAAGGTKEMVVRAAAEMPPGSTDYLPPVQRAFETIAFAKVSTSAADAMRLGYLESTDAITMNRERLIADAKAHALQRVHEGYQPPAHQNSIPVGGDAVLAPLTLGIHLARRSGRISDHDARIGRTLATIMAGGALPHPSVVTELHLLDLEREAFLSLLGEEKTLERIQYTLKTGKTLRN